ncbi:Na+/H+ antiporter NhaC [Leptobacterium flavescens]|uniref:Na+/H+ antiporter NhaC n=1 Tax=Leptobacterium flavescens TaxID=472055 RepID=A0A6P0UXG4_9FLAO|nr:Na+/H+ antiporter NhaC [Leptobacterium flavescens]NER15373.1 Na+/H+ antiporter NhaC [Leptobacterium flavescens]
MKHSDLKTYQLLLPVFFLFVLISFGLVIGPVYFDLKPFPLEVIFLLAAVFSATQLMILGYKWHQVQNAIVKKIAEGFPIILIFFSIGILIGSWMISGTIPMLVYYGIKLINPSYIYVIAFIVPIIFSLLTGTSWGSIATIGVVIIGVASLAGVDLGITAGAIVGGAYFGDKMSPLSDTTNLASAATGVELYSHIHSMMYTTLPSALIASIIFFSLSFVYPPATEVNSALMSEETLTSINKLFNFNLLLIIPPLIVLYGSIKRKPTVPVMLLSAFSACFLALIFQGYSLQDLVQTLLKGYNVNMAVWESSVPENVAVLFNRGGLYALNEAIFFTFMVFIFIGILDMVKAMPTLVNIVFKGVRKRWALIISSLIATAVTNAFTSNQSATSFIIGDAFRSAYDKLKVPRKVLSRSIEDYGTMIETLIPWTASTLFVVATLGVSYADYWHWQLLSILNILVAPLLAITGIGCFYGEQKKTKNA